MRSSREHKTWESKKISPGACPEFIEGVDMTFCFSSRLGALRETYLSFAILYFRRYPNFSRAWRTTS